MILTAAVPVQKLRDAVPPIAMISQLEPQVPVLHPMHQRLIKAPHCQQRFAPHQRARGDVIAVQKHVPCLETRAIVIVDCAKVRGRAFGHVEMGIGFQEPDQLLQGGWLDEVIIVNKKDVSPPRLLQGNVTRASRSPVVR